MTPYIADIVQIIEKFTSEAKISPFFDFVNDFIRIFKNEIGENIINIITQMVHRVMNEI